MKKTINFKELKNYLFEAEENFEDAAISSIIKNLKLFDDIKFSQQIETKDYITIVVNSENPLKARAELSSYKFSHATNLIVDIIKRSKGDGLRLAVYDEDGDPFDKDIYIQIRKGGEYNAGVENELNFIDVLKNAGTQSIKFKDKNGKELVLKNVESIRDCSKDPGSRMGNRADVEIITDGKPFRISLKKDTAYKAAGVKNRFKPQAFKIGKIVRKYFIDNELAFEDFPYITIPITNPELYRWCVFGNDMKNEGAVIQSAFSKDDVIEQINKPAIFVDKILTPDEDDKTLMEEFPICLLLSINKRGGVEVRSAVIGEFARRYFKDDLIIPGVNDNSITESMQDRKYGIFHGYHIYTDMDENNIFHTCYKIKDFGIRGTMYVVVVSETETEIQYLDLKWNEEKQGYGPETQGDVCTVHVEYVETGMWRKRSHGIGMEEVQ